LHDPTFYSLRLRCLDYLQQMTFYEREIKRNTLFKL
jgi:hypothetical protein